VGQVIQKLRTLRPEALLAVCGGLLLVLLAAQGVRYEGARRLAAEFDAGLRVQDPAPADPKEDDKEQLKKLTEKGLFGKKPAPPQPKLFGILGASAMMGNDAKGAKLYEVDASLPDGSKLVEVQANAVVVERDGKRKTILLFPALGGPSEGSPPSGGPPPPSGPPQIRPAAAPGGAPAVPAAAPPMPQLPSDMPPEVQAKIREAMERARAAAAQGGQVRVWTRFQSADEVSIDDSADDPGDDEEMDNADSE